jgi:rhomboid protease GluP
MLSKPTFMKNLQLKLRVVYLPFLLVAIGTVLAYSIIRWLLDSQLGILPTSAADLFNIWLPIILPWIPVLVWLRPRTRILNLKFRYEDGYFLYHFAMGVAIAIPLLLSQFYITEAAFSLIEINSPQEVRKFPKEKYFNIKSFAVDKNALVPHIDIKTSGENDQNLNFHLYLACPFDNAPNVWYGVDYRKQIPDNSTTLIKEETYNSFLNQSYIDFAQYDVQDVNYFEKFEQTSDYKNGFLNAVQKAPARLSKQETIILTPRTNAFGEFIGKISYWMFMSVGIGMLLILIMVIIPKIDEEEWERFRTKQPLQKDELKDFLSYLDPRGATPASTTLLLLNLAIFIIMVFYGLDPMVPTAQELLDLGGNRRTEVLNGEYWRLLTSIFVHSGLAHLIVNLLLLGIVGYFLEDLIGKFKLVTSFFISGIGANLASIIWYDNMVSIGASGAISGWCGLILMFTIFKIYTESLRDLTKLFLGLLIGTIVVSGLFEHIDYAAHLGGFVTGCIIGLILVLWQRKELTERSHKKDAEQDPFAHL